METELIEEFIEVRTALFGMLIEYEFPLKGVVEAMGENWRFYTHGELGRMFESDQGRIVDFEDVSRPLSLFSLWEFLTFVSSGGRTADKFVRSQVGLHNDSGKARVKAYICGLVEDGYLIAGEAPHCYSVLK